ncbi:MAG: ATP-dependent protease [SAR202 cluster bacterium]|nr:ATP-dependent protease [SAR202 cluster bacterium]
MADRSKRSRVTNGMGICERARIPSDRLTTTVRAEELGFTSTREVAPLEGTIGQDRALRALEFGLGVRTPGFNVFVSGQVGTGRNTTLATYLRTVAASRPTPNDWVYVHNFRDSLKPRGLSLPPGMGKQFAREMAELVTEVRTRVPRAFESEQYKQRMQEGLRDLEARHRRMTEEMLAEAKRRGFDIAVTPGAMLATPLSARGEPLQQEEFQAMPPEDRAALEQRHRELMEYLAGRTAELRQLDKEVVRQRQGVDRQIADFALRPLFDDLRRQYGEWPETLEYLQEVHDDMLENMQAFRLTAEQVAEQGSPEMAAAFAARMEQHWEHYRINLFMDNSRMNGAPVVFEYSPTYYNVFGRIDHALKMGALSTDFMMLHAGAAHRANGGFLVLQAREVLTNPFVWQALKQALRSGELRMENLGEQVAVLPTMSLSPEPIPFDVKIILVGSPMIARLLFMEDEDFSKYFKVRADFEYTIPLNRANIRKFGSFVMNRVQQEGLLHFHASGVARLAEFSSRLVEDQEKLTTRFSEIADVITEANFWALQAGHNEVTGEHVVQALAERRRRSSLVENQLEDLYDRDILRVEVDGESVGQVNGLAVIDMGDYSFGRPSRLTARVGAGRGEVVNIEEGSRMSGRIHTKGFQILTGYLMGKYGVEGTLPLRATVAFEQTYEEVEGDSASSAELYALLSAITNVPIFQGLAVTGSVDQQGRVQAVGGVTRKVEGFYNVCKSKGITGKQGVIVPAANARNLVLDREVVQAIEDGLFHVYAVSTIDEGLELLTGMSMGEPDGRGIYPKDTINRRIHDALKAMNERMRPMGAERRVVERDDRAPNGSKKPPPTPASGRDRREGDGTPPSPPPE